MTNHSLKKHWVLLSGAFLVLALGILVLAPIAPESKPGLRGYTFSVAATDYLGLSAQDVFEQSIQQLQPDIIRLPLYWNRIEREQGIFDWQESDRFLDTLNTHDVPVILVIGHKQPRWPECHLPEWVDQSDEAGAQQAIRRFLTEAVGRYSQHPQLYAWQVENEALFPFGDCPAWSSNRGFLKKEIELVKNLDTDTPVFTSDSGELSLWWRTATLPVDGIAISLYRVVYNNGLHYWPVNPYYYRLRRAIIAPLNKRFIVSELQTEPWGSKPVRELSDEEITASYSPEALEDRFVFAESIGAEAVLAWGVEWWYYRMVHDGDARYWESAKALFNTHAR